MPTLQQALAAIAAAIPKPAPPVRRAAPAKPTPAARPPGPRRVAFNTFARLQPLRPTGDPDAFDRPSKSEAPPVHEPNFAERYFT